MQKDYQMSENESEMFEDIFIKDVTKILVDMKGHSFDDMAKSIWKYIIAYKAK